ncbi:DNA methyltransferase [Tetragenococcus halophilus]|nr:site-specific DNA-methyltransferase [Tetragenococcus halophilus]MDN6571198.1 site-specific DNA-methyltransferase [Staphylococcus equorum]GMG69729.1 site-specific DNA-methyltransferase [Tetragenococcus halophilus]
MSTSILDEISKILNGIERYWINEKLAKQVIIEDLRNNEPKLISKLLSNQAINETYVQDIDGYKVFDKEAFISMLRYKNYWQDSYTKYANKIGLTAEGKYLNYNSDVILDFPFKDCILEGGMTKEDSILKNDEKFYNEVIAKEEIDTLLTPKAFTKIKRYNKDGTHNIKEIKEKDNLIIKGNNLTALYSLKKKYTGKVKLIYIDPPYNTGNDEFKYNDRFNKATWLTFMKNRLEIARELLSDDGILFVSLDDNEAHYAKVLIDSIFGSENFIADICHKARASVSNDKIISSNHNHILFFAKSERKLYSQRHRLGIKNKLEGFNLKDENGFYKIIPVDGPGGAAKGNPYYEFLGVSGYWRYSFETMNKLYEKGRIIKRKNTIGKKYYKIEAENKKRKITTWWDESLLTSTATKQLSNLFGEKKFNNPKNESLLELILEYCTKEKDLVLDFFMGSGTTQAVAHKMNRQYIGIEQMDYVNTVSIPRLQKVIEGEQSGISKDIEWQGGGSFIYAELAKENQEIVESIITCNTKEELSQQIDKLLNEGVLNYEVDFEKFTNTKKEFSELELEDQKEVLIRILDNNQLYVNYSDMEDSAYNFTEDEIAFNHSFYGGE